MQKSRYVKVVGRKIIRGDDPIEYFFPTGSKILVSPRGVMAVEVPQNEEISGGENNGGRKGVGFAIHRRNQIRVA